MAKRDYYEVLGVPRSASEADIRKAYRRLARQYHPDVNKDPDAAKMFSEATEAYDVLTDPEKRKVYDYLGHEGLAGGAQQAARPDARPGKGHARWSTGPRGGGFEEFFGGRGFDFGDMFGFGGQRAQQPMRGEDIEYQLTLDFLQAVHGVTTTIQVPRPTGKGDFRNETIKVKIPPGVDDGSRVRVRSKGSPGYRGGAAGDLYIVTRVQEHPVFRRQGLDVYVDLPVSVSEALLGGSVEVPSLDGPATVKVPAGTSSGTRLRLKGKGIRDAKSKAVGDEYAVVKIVVPRTLSPRGQELARQLAETDPYDPRRPT